MHEIVGNPCGCYKPDEIKPKTGKECFRCYYAQVIDGKWHGIDKCFNAQCLVIKED